MTSGRRVALSMLRIALVAVLVWSSPPAIASPRAESSFDGWSLSGTALDGQGRSEAIRKAASPCAEVHSLIESYNAAEPWSEPDSSYASRITPINLSRYQIDSVQGWAGVEMSGAFETCTNIHNTGWLPAGSGILSIAGVDDPGCGYGELAFVRAHFLYRPESGWAFAPGVNHTDDFGGFEISGSNPVEVICGRIFDESTDVAGFSESVPPVQVNHNPTVSGLAGVETWLWYDFARPNAPSSVSGSATIEARGTTWTLTARAWVDLISWDVDCTTQCDFRGMATAFEPSSPGGLFVDFADSPWGPAGEYDGGAGTEHGAAARHVYEESGVYTISTIERWRGRYAWSGVSYPYARVVVTGSRRFEVKEARGILTAPAR